MFLTFLALAALFYFYKINGFKCLIRAAELATDPEPIPPRRAPAKVYSPPKQPEPIPEAKQEPAQKVDRVKLEKIAGNCLTACGVKFDTYYYCRNKTDLELMDIIKDYNIYHID